MLWKAVGMATGWKAGRCRHVQVSELFSRDECDQAEMDFLAATEVGKFPPKRMEGWSEQGGGLRCGERQLQAYILSFLFLFLLVLLLCFWSFFKSSFVSGDEG
jgi:hypothetical protein